MILSTLTSCTYPILLLVIICLSLNRRCTSLTTASTVSTASATLPTVAPPSPVIPGYELTKVQFPVDWGSHFWSALSRCSTRLVRVAVLGDSVSAGDCASNQYPNAAGRGYVQVLAEQFRAQCPDGGSGLQSPSSNAAFAGNVGYTDQQLPVHQEGFVDVNYDLGTMGAAYFRALQPNATLAFYTRGTQLTVFYLVGPEFGSFTVHVDGVLVATLYTASPMLAQRTASFLASAGEHRLVLTTQSSAEVSVTAVSGEYSAGVLVDNISLPGISLAQMCSVNTSLVGSPFASADGGLFHTADMLLIMLGLNDASYGYSVDEMKAAFTTAVTSYQAGGVDDILIVMSNGNGDVFASYREMLPSLTAELGVAFIDLNDVRIPNRTYLCEQGFLALTDGPGQSACTHPGLPSTNHEQLQYRASERCGAFQHGPSPIPVPVAVFVCPVGLHHHAWQHQRRLDVGTGEGAPNDEKATLR